MDYYEDDLDDRDNEIEILQTQLIEISQKLVVARAERTEAYDQRDELLQQAYQCTKEMEELNDKVDIGEQENKELRQKCNLLEEQVSVQCLNLQCERYYSIEFQRIIFMI